ncbi:MAG: citrate/H+ symporter, CitMHS family [Sporomusa sp.]|jgi:CitMHS family citrate-Mg2+:H+ or citrate-Ca2+:H+ symporter|nr:citrate/H+ symporter, CitMHS family [Sporomusa sp.]
MEYYAVVGFIMVAILMYVLLKGNANPVILFSTLPVIAGLSLGLSIFDISAIIKKGISATMVPAALAVFSPLFFGILNELGTFTPAIDFLVRKARGSLIGVTVGTVLLCMLVGIEGSATNTILIVFPPMIIIYKRYNMRLQILYTLMALTCGTLNVTPWGAPLLRLAAVTKLDPHQMWLHWVPVQIPLLIGILVLAVYFAIIEKRRGAGLSLDAETEMAATVAPAASAETKYATKGHLYFNQALTASLIGLLFWGKIPAIQIFMFLTAILVLVNFRGLKEQSDVIKRNSSAAYTVASIMLSAGFLVGMLNETPMLLKMADVILKMIPNALGPYLHIIMAFVSLPLGVMIGFDAFIFGLIPICIKVGESFGISAEAMGLAMLIGKNLGQSLQPVSHLPYLALSFLGGELKDYWGFTFKYAAIATIYAVVVAIFVGLLPIPG